MPTSTHMNRNALQKFGFVTGKKVSLDSLSEAQMRKRRNENCSSRDGSVINYLLPITSKHRSSVSNRPAASAQEPVVPSTRDKEAYGGATIDGLELKEISSTLDNRCEKRSIGGEGKRRVA